MIFASFNLFKLYLQIVKIASPYPAPELIPLGI